VLVDLARNDLSRNGHTVTVDKYREVQFSHVIHLVSRVTGHLHEKQHHASSRRYFPAGTLSGAPKHRAMQLIEEYEKQIVIFMEVP
jgi:anthranilate synthase component 1